MHTRAALANTLCNACDNADPAAVCGPNGLQLCCPPLDEAPFTDAAVVLHDGFMTASFDGDSVTVVADAAGCDEAAAFLVEALGL